MCELPLCLLGCRRFGLWRPHDLLPVCRILIELVAACPHCFQGLLLESLVSTISYSTSHHLPGKHCVRPRCPCAGMVVESLDFFATHACFSLATGIATCVLLPSLLLALLLASYCPLCMAPHCSDVWVTDLPFRLPPFRALVAAQLAPVVQHLDQACSCGPSRFTSGCLLISTIF